MVGGFNKNWRDEMQSVNYSFDQVGGILVLANSRKTQIIKSGQELGYNIKSASSFLSFILSNLDQEKLHKTLYISLKVEKTLTEIFL